MEQQTKHIKGILLILTTSLLLVPLTAIAQQIQPIGGNSLGSKLLHSAGSHHPNLDSHQQLQPPTRNINRDFVNNHLTNNLMTSNPNHQNHDSQQQQQQKTISTAVVTSGHYMKAVEDSLLGLRQALISKSFKFDGHFRELLSKSKRDLHMMFVNTYGNQYESNTEIFTNMYGSLEQYYNEGKVNLTKSMDEFFANLYKRVFQVYNGYRRFSDEYLECVANRLTEMKPFKEVPEKLVRGIKYTFVAARTLSKSLNEGIDVLRNIIALVQSNQCTGLINDKLIKYQQAPSGSKQTICLPYCEQVIVRCLGKDTVEQLNDKWRAYLQTLSEVASKLSTSYNIETIIEPLNVQISEAIMNFQDEATNITQRVYQICGGASKESPIGHIPVVQNSHAVSRQQTVPKLSGPANRRNRRSANPSAQRTRQSTYKFSGYENLSQDLNHRPMDQRASTVEQKSSILIDEMRKFFASSKSFWSMLPNSVCNSVLGTNVTTSSIVHSSLGKKQHTNCYSEPFSIMDINSDLRLKTELFKQSHQLEIVKYKLDEALRGAEVDWPGQDQQQSFELHVSSVTIAPLRPSTTSTSAASIEAGPDDEEEEEYDQTGVEEGSGCDPISCPEQDPDCCEQSETVDTTENPSEDDESSSATPYTDPSNIPDTLDNNDIDKPSITSQPYPDDLALITPPNQAGFQKSGQTSHKLVINSGGQILLSSIMSVALLFVTNFSTRSRFISLSMR